MSIREKDKLDLELMSYTDIAYEIIKEDKKQYNTPNLFREVCNLLELSEAEFEAKIGDFFTALTTDKRFISYFNKEKTENTNSYIINTNKKIYTIPFGNSLTHILNEEKKKFINTRNNDKNPSYSTTFINNINNQNENRIIDNTDNKAKKLRKIINLYYSKNDLDNKKENKNENVFEEKENKDINNKKKKKKRKSMFMTEMNFLINNDNNRKRSKIKKTKEIKHNKENEFKNNNYDSINFKELLKHIERDKKKIINNQNDIDNMLKTTKDTFYEIWKYNHH